MGNERDTGPDRQVVGSIVDLGVVGSIVDLGSAGVEPPHTADDLRVYMAAGTADRELYTVEDGWIETYTGVRLYFGAPTPEMLRLADVAHVLPRLARYNGHTRRFYSVAEHACLMRDWVASRGGSPRDRLTALHHDDAEFVIGDLPRPIKHKMSQFKEVESKLDQALALRFHTEWPMPPWLKDIDSRILKDERRQVMRRSDNEWGTDRLEELGVRLWAVRGRFQSWVRHEWVRRHVMDTAALAEQMGLPWHSLLGDPQ